MLPGNYRDIGRPARAAAARPEEWEVLLEIFRSADSAVGAAVHWVESHGGGSYGRRDEGRGNPARGPEKKKKRIQELWRFVPELLMSEVVYVEEKKEEKEKVQTKGGSHLDKLYNGRFLTKFTPLPLGDSCLWLQTLPSVMQANILTFLSVAHWHFHAEDLEFLARTVLRSPVNPDFWVSRAASRLLSSSLNQLRVAASSANGDSGSFQKFASTAPIIDGSFQPLANQRHAMVGMEDYEALPDWLERYSKPQNHPVSAESLPSSSRKNDKQVMGNDNAGEQELLTPEKCTKTVNFRRHTRDSGSQNSDGKAKMIDVSKPPTQVDDTILSKESEVPNTRNKGEAKDVPEVETEGGASRSSGIDQDAAAKVELGDALFTQALSLRDALHSCQDSGLPEEISLLKSTLNPSALLSVVRAWEVNDEVTLLLVSSLVTELDGYARSTKILESIVLPKLVHLEAHASRILITAVMHAGKTHPRATMDALAVPLICTETGANILQCDVLSRLVKECFPDEVNSALCEKMFLGWNTTEHRSRLNGTWPWTEGMVSMVHNLFSTHRLILDEPVFAGLVSALEVAASEHPSSVKLANLLLKLLTKYGLCLKPYKARLQKVLERSKTFLTKSLLGKLDAL